MTVSSSPDVRVVGGPPPHPRPEPPSERQLTVTVGWRVAITHPDTTTVVCAPTMLSPTGPEVSYRAACRACDWISTPLFESENAAVEAAHDHSHPGFRDLPAVELPAGWRQNPDTKQIQAARTLLEGHYPPGWIAAGGAPSWSYRHPRATRHVPGGGLFGGYDLARPIDDTRAEVGQGRLFR